MMPPNTVSSLIRVGSSVETGMYGYFFQFPQMIKIYRRGWKTANVDSRPTFLICI